MLPLKDLNPTRRIPVLTYGLIAINLVVFFWEIMLPADALDAAFFRLAVVPANVVQDPFAIETFMDFVRSMFFHGGWAHLIGNMLYLWLFGDNIEDRMGIPVFLIIYFLSGFAATLAQIIVEPGSPIPMIGASGAIAGILGGYLVLFPGVKVRGIIPLGWYIRSVEWPAWAVLGLWFVLQLFNGAVSVGHGWRRILCAYWRFYSRPCLDRDLHDARPSATTRAATRSALRTRQTIPLLNISIFRKMARL
jgi:membrane associated rhomboid family serine protease